MLLPPPLEKEKSIDNQYNSIADIANVLSDLINEDHFCFPWGRLYRRDIIERYHIRFDERMRFAEDNVFVWEYLSHISSSMYVNFAAIDYHKMDDDGRAGYNLSFEEMDYIDGRLFELSKRLENHYNVRLCLVPSQLMHVLFLRDMLQLPASGWYAYYKKYHPQGTEKEGYGFIMRTIYYMTLVRLSKIKDKQEQKVAWTRLNRFIDKPFTMLKNSDIKTRFLIPFIKWGMYSPLQGIIGKMLR